MKKLMISTMVAMMAVVVGAQELGSKGTESAEKTPVAVAKKTLPPKTGEGQAVAEMQLALAEDIKPAETAKEAIENYFNSKPNWNKGYDEAADRIIVSDFIEFDIKNPKVSADFLELRKEKISELTLKAKAKIIETIMSKMSGARILDVPGNPIAKQLEKETKEMDAALAVAREELEKLDKDLSEALKLRDGVTASELVAVISSWFTAAEKQNLAEKFDADKKERYANAKADFEAAALKYKELAGKAEALKGTISKEMKSSIDRVAAMPIYGCTVLQQAESISERNGRYKYQIAILYSWSGEMMKASGEILKGKSVKFRQGKKTMKEWIADKVANKALSQWIGPRNYIDKNGDMWFLGISCAAIDEDAENSEKNREAAELEAAAEVVFALYADVESSKTLDKLMQTKVGANGEKETQIYKDFRKSQSEAFKDIMISGNGELWSGTVHHDPSGLDMHVVVYGVNSGSTKALKDILNRTLALGVEVNTYQEKIRGEMEALKKIFETSKKNSAARRAGASAAVQKIAAATAVKEIATESQKIAKTRELQLEAVLKLGTTMIVDDED